jgi:cysteine desulfurase/selenocysteine lyase
MSRLGVAATTRASMYLYNTTEEMDALVRAVHAAKKVFGV